MRIVVVEDERKTRAGIIRLIGKLNPDYEVVGEAEDGRAGLSLIRQLQPDVVILDVQMPVMSGLEMLEELKRSGASSSKLVILSGHSEFEYARQALRLGACEYMMKPITAEDLERTLWSLQQSIVLEQLLGTDRIEHGDSASPFMPGPPVFSAAIHLSDPDTARSDQALTLLRERIRTMMPESVLLLERAASGCFLLLVQEASMENEGDSWTERLIDQAEHSLRECGFTDNVWMWQIVDRLFALPKQLDSFLELANWAIVLGNRIPLAQIGSADKASRPLAYPLSLEIQMKKAISSSSKEGVTGTIHQFLQECLREQHRPKDILEACYRMVSSALHVRGQFEQSGADYLEGKQLLLAVSEARTRNGLERALLSVAAKVVSAGAASESYGLLVSKALNMVRERFAQGITLEESAAALNITPEYLSTLINRETGRTFIAHVKEMRVARAKELLLAGELKAFEVGVRVGYADSKYFCRVFKEHTGMTPVEYQKNH